MVINIRATGRSPVRGRCVCVHCVECYCLGRGPYHNENSEPISSRRCFTTFRAINPMQLREYELSVLHNRSETIAINSRDENIRSLSSFTQIIMEQRREQNRRRIERNNQRQQNRTARLNLPENIANRERNDA